MADAGCHHRQGPCPGRRSAAQKGGPDAHGLGRSKGGLTTKLHLTGDALGLPVRILATPGNRNDITQAAALLEGLQAGHVIADKGYDGESAIEAVRKAGAVPDVLLLCEHPHVITLGRNGALTLPAMNFAGTPAGIDVRRVVDTGILPIINTGIAHREPGIGQIGAGITHAPLHCFAQAVAALAALLPDP